MASFLMKPPAISSRALTDRASRLAALSLRVAQIALRRAQQIGVERRPGSSSAWAQGVRVRVQAIITGVVSLRPVVSVCVERGLTGPEGKGQQILGVRRGTLRVAVLSPPAQRNGSADLRQPPSAMQTDAAAIWQLACSM